jgi:hypothetical protein
MSKLNDKISVSFVDQDDKNDSLANQITESD